MNDSGPYEKIVESDEEEEEGPAAAATRAPMGDTGDFISLAGFTGPEQSQQDRLI